MSRTSEADAEVQVKTFDGQVPNARIVWLPNADHVVCRSNEADVLRDIRAFVATLLP